MKIISKSIAETEKIARDFIRMRINADTQNADKRGLNTRTGADGNATWINAGENMDRALVVGLYGDLGSGKTTFTQAVAKIFGIKEDITSPTFVIEKIYPISTWTLSVQVEGGKADKFKRLIHIDAYRLDSAKELLALDWEKTLGNPGNIVFIEWPERVLDVLPQNHVKIYFKFVGENEREIEI